MNKIASVLTIALTSFAVSFRSPLPVEFSCSKSVVEPDGSGFVVGYTQNLSSAEEEPLVSLINEELSRGNFEVEVPSDEYSLEDLLSAGIRATHTPSLFYIGTSFSVEQDDGSFIVNFVPVYDNCEAKKKALEQLRSEIISKTADISDEKLKVKYVYDYLCSRFEYGTESEAKCQNAYEVLTKNVTLCQGYSYAFKYLLDGMGIPSEVYIGYGKTPEGYERHAWNSVEFDGETCYIDVTYGDEKQLGFWHWYFLSEKEFIQNHVPFKEFPMKMKSFA